MAQKIGDLLGSKNYREPPEIKLIKEFVVAQIGITPKVTLTTESYVIRVPSAAAAGALRASLFKLQKQLQTKNRVLIRIG